MRRSRKTDAAGGFATLALLLIVSLSTGPAVGADPAHDGPEQSSQSGEWKLLHLQAAPSGYTTNLLFDPVSSRTMLLESNDSGGKHSTNLWSFDPSSHRWVMGSTSGGPWTGYIPMQAITAAPQGSEAVAFGNGGSDETWLFDFGNSTWSQVMTEPRPPRGSIGVIAPSAPRGQYLLLTGRDSNETWLFDVGNETWARSNGSGAPDPRTFAAMAYDEAASVVVLFGGGGTPRRNDTWIFDPSTGKWQNVTTGLRPPGRSAHAMTFDARLGKVVLFGGCCRGSNPYSSLPFDDVWTFDATSREWSPLPMPGPVPGRAGHGMVYDRNAGVLVVFGNQLWLGSTGTRDTWTLDSLRHEWVSRSAPQGGYGHLAVDRLSGEVVAIGGPLANEAWSFDGGIGTWSFIGATNRSYGYYSASAVDTARSRIVIHRRSALADGQRSLGVRSPEQDVDEPDEPGRAPAELGRGARI